MTGGVNGAFERFNEFLSGCFDPLNTLCDTAEAAQLNNAFQQRAFADWHLLYYVVIEGYFEQKYAWSMGLAQKTVHYGK